ncbi:DUF6785 family protein, partial [Oceanidesulfovibrio marinus]
MFIRICYGLMLCLVNLCGHHCVVNELVHGPLLRLPHMMAYSFYDCAFVKFLGNKSLLLGFILVLFLHTVNVLTNFGLFSCFHKLKIYIYPAFLGLAFLTTRQISLCCWFFFLLGGLSYALFSAMRIQVPSAGLVTTFGRSLARPEDAQVIGAPEV